MRRTPRSALLALVPLLALLAACGASGGDEASPSGDKATTTAAASEGSGDDGSGSTTTEASDGGDPADVPSVAALVDILPTATDIGDGYEVSDEDLTDEPDDEASDDTGSDPTEDAILEACPGAEVIQELDNSRGDNPDEVSREFSTDTDKTVEVSLDPTGGDFTEENVDKVVEALADCGTIKTEQDGAKVEMTIKAERNDDVGDFGVQMSMDATFELMGTPVEISFRGRIFSVDGVTVSVVATSGLDDTSFTAVPGDYDLVPTLSNEMQDRVAAL
jgi:hypothetical protein